MSRFARVALALGGAVVGLAWLVASPALAAGGAPQWTVTAVSAPTDFRPGSVGEDSYTVRVTNTGDAASDGTPVTVSDELPSSLALSVGGASGIDELLGGSSSLIYHKGLSGAGFTCVLRKCTFSGTVVPDDTLILTFPVDVLLTDEAQVVNVVRVAGGGAPDASVSTPTQVSQAPAPFGVSPGGIVTALSRAQAGAHPDLTTQIAFNTVNVKGSLAGDPKDLITEEPAGFAGDLVDTPVCVPAVFAQHNCPTDTQIGIVNFTFLETTDNAPHLEHVALYNLSPNPGEVAKFGFVVASNFAIQGNVAVRPGDYGLKVSFHNTDQTLAELDSVSLTVWGVPASPVHDIWRWKSGGGSAGGHFGMASEVLPVPYFTNPTSCGDSQFAATFSVSSWQEPERFVGAEMPFGPIVGCDRLSLPASFSAEATSENASAPSGLNVNLGVKQTYENAEGLATSTLNKAVVTLPEGMTVNPSAGSGLAACSLAQYTEEGLEEVAGKGCPNESKLGTVEIVTPSLAEKATGSVFLAEPAPHGEPGKNPFDTLLAIYVVARFPQRGVLVKVAGRINADPLTGRLVTTFEGQPDLGPLPNGTAQPGLGGLPPVPFTTFTFKFHQGTTSPLVTPPVCGSYAATVGLSPWSEPEQTLFPMVAPFSITRGPGGGACPSGIPPFSPQVIAGAQSNAAGSYSPFYLRLVREDGEQEITRFTTILPPGLTGNLTGIPFCPDAAIEAARQRTGQQELHEPSCPATSEIGHTLVGAGVGSVLAWTPGKIYLAGPYHGSALSIVSVTSATVGPFDLGTVVIRFALKINPTTAQVEVDGSNSDPIPHIIDGIVVHVRDIHVYVDRSKFTINPTSCGPMSISNTITGAGANIASPADDVPVGVSTRFQAANCQALQFKPNFKITTSGQTSRKNGASLNVKLTYPSAPLGTQANIAKVKVDLPRQLPSRLTTLQKACVDRVFNADPAACPAESRVGTATTTTPIVPVPLSGPAYFVSHGAAKFPELIIVLQGYGITIDLHGETFISKKGLTSTTFRTIPDEPVGSFELNLPTGRYSALSNNGDLCKSKLLMPMSLVAQNGIAIHQNTRIAVTGCPKNKAKHARKAAGNHGAKVNKKR
jgi:uncharacterized repeat protein (TIGR01451 family)